MESVAFRPHPGMQTEFCRRGEMEILGGGAAGPGKTACLLAMPLRYVWHPLFRGVLFRRTYPQLEEIIDRTHRLYPEVVHGADYRASEHRWVFPPGGPSRPGRSWPAIRLCHMQHEANKYDHQGHEYQWAGFDELTQFTETQYTYIFSRLRRSVAVEGIRPVVRSSSNPGGIGHAWVKRRFRIGLVAPGTTIFEDFRSPVTGRMLRTSRAFIAGRLADNPSVDPDEYVGKLMHLPEVERMRLLEGIWDTFEGQAFSELNADVHAFDWDVPPDWEVFGSFDWGAAKPYSYGLWAVDYDDRIYRFAELYGGLRDEQTGEYLDKGVRENDVEIARKILELEEKYRVRPRYRVADPAIWNRRPKKDGAPGPSPEETMRREGVNFVPGDNARVAGRRQLHHRLRVDEEDGRPWVYFHHRCGAFWQTVPLIRESEKHPEDTACRENGDEENADHVYDEVRYAVQSRPMSTQRPKKSDTGSFQAERRRLLAAKDLAARRGISVEEAYRRAR